MEDTEKELDIISFCILQFAVCILGVAATSGMNANSKMQNKKCKMEVPSVIFRGLKLYALPATADLRRASVVKQSSRPLGTIEGRGLMFETAFYCFAIPKLSTIFNFQS